MDVENGWSFESSALMNYDINLLKCASLYLCLYV